MNKRYKENGIEGDRGRNSTQQHRALPWSSPAIYFNAVFKTIKEINMDGFEEHVVCILDNPSSDQWISTTQKTYLRFIYLNLVFDSIFGPPLSSYPINNEKKKAKTKTATATEATTVIIKRSNRTRNDDTH